MRNTILGSVATARDAVPRQEVTWKAVNYRFGMPISATVSRGNNLTLRSMEGSYFAQTGP
jgi:hypothetical protein